MWIQVRTMDGRKSARVDSLSKLTTIEELRERLVGEFGAEPERQRLFYRGKQVSWQERVPALREPWDKLCLSCGFMSGALLAAPNTRGGLEIRHTFAYQMSRE